MKYLIISSLLVFAVSCSSSKKVIEKAPEVVKETVTSVAEPTPAIVEETPATEPAMPIESGELPDITGNSILDVNCTAGQDKRVISLLERTDDRGWGVTYTKFGATKTIAIARNDKSFCEEIVSRVKGTLQGAGFQCDGDVETSVSPVTGDSSSTQKTVMDKAKEAASGASEGAKSMLDKAKDAAGGAAEAAKGGAEAAMDKVKETAGDAAEAVKGE